ncbi:MAG TPA: hypothetical protein VH637_16635 [Streptosporangiaceae bacterium]|jgi:hypothetical protein
MDPATVGAVLLALVTGVGEAVGGQLWGRVVSLVRRKPAAERAAVAGSLGTPELAALQQAPRDQERAVALATVLLARAAADEGFGRELRDWWEQAAPVRAQVQTTVTNTISGGTQHGPVLQGQTFTNITFGVATPPAPPPSEPGTAE